MPFVKVRGVNTFYRQSGGGSDLVLIHGVGGNLACWYLSGLVTLASPFFRITALDLRGHGNSDTPRTGYDSRNIALDLIEFMQQLDVGPAILIGHSFGAVVATQTALLEPEKVTSLILSEAYFPGLNSLQDRPEEWPGWSSYARRSAKLGIRISEDWLNLENLFQQIDNLSPPDVQKFEEVVGLGALSRLKRLSGTTCGRDVGDPAGLTWDSILRLQHPVECVYGEFSPFLPTCNYLVDNLLRCTARTIPGVEHFAFDEDPESFQQVIVQSLCALNGLSLSQFGRIKKGELVGRKETVMTPSPSESKAEG